MLIDVSFFISGPRHIMNATAATMPQQNSLSVNAAIVSYIKHYQLAFLCELLGDGMAVAIDDYLTEKDQALKDGTEFETVEQYELLCGKIRESFADYVFFYILRDANTQATDRGLVIWKNDNEVVSPLHRQVSIWNEMVKRNIRFKSWAAANALSVEVSKNMTTPINQFNL